MFKPVFIKSAARPADFPDDEGIELAVVGRSNSGKSSAINCIVGMRKLARVSKTPGRTQLINFFELAPERRVVDLPGYGFARVPDAMRLRWRGLIEAYFGSRQSLRGLMITVDIRRGLVELDLTMIDWVSKLGIPMLLLLTKTDKLSRGVSLAQLRQVEQQAPAGAASILFSAIDKTGVNEARTQLRDWLDLDS